MSAWVRGNLLWKGRIFKKKSEIPQNDLTKPNIEGQVCVAVYTFAINNRITGIVLSFATGPTTLHMLPAKAGSTL